MEAAVRLFGQALVGSAEAAALVLLIAAVLWLGRKTLPPLWSYALWFLLLAKLLLPLVPGDVGSQLRWFPMLDAVEARMPAFETAAQDVGESLPLGRAEASEPERADGGALSNAVKPARDGSWAADSSKLQIAAAIWLSGIAVALLFPLIGHLAMRRALRREPVRAVPRELDERFMRIRTSLGIRSRVELRLTGQVSGPALFGLFSPVVLVPYDLIGRLSEAEWECVLRHELTHYRRKDIWINLLAYSLVSAHWFNPLAWYGLRSMRIAQENACDAKVLSGTALKEAYASCMIKLLELGVSRKVALSGVGFFGSKKMIVRRIEMIRDYKPARRRATFAGAAVFVLAGALMLPSALAADKKEPAQKQSTVQVVAPKDDGAEDIKLLLKLPKDAKISSRYGYRIHPVTSEKTLHDGIDIAGKAGSDVFAAGSGKVVAAEYDTAKGFTVTIQHNEAWSTEYRHLDKLAVEAGDEVKSGHLIGELGSTGQSTGPHLHFSVLKQGEYVDPLSMTVIKTK